MVRALVRVPAWQPLSKKAVFVGTPASAVSAGGDVVAAAADVVAVADDIVVGAAAAEQFEVAAVVVVAAVVEVWIVGAAEKSEVVAWRAAAELGEPLHPKR